MYADAGVCVETSNVDGLAVEIGTDGDVTGSRVVVGVGSVSVRAFAPGLGVRQLK